LIFAPQNAIIIVSDVSSKDQVKRESSQEARSIMSHLKYAATETETRPATRPIPKEALPANPNEPFGVVPEIIEEIEQIGRRYEQPQK
jgi:hypothetical protein